MSINEQELEQQIQAKGLNAPRLSPESINAVVVGADYYVFPGTSTTVCRLALANGYSVVGTSACVSLDNFDEEIGKKIAYEHARNQIWQLEGYLLAHKLSEQ